MIIESTVLVLGAGASMPYNFPSGLELKRNILKNLKGKDSEFYRSLSKVDSESIIDEFHHDLSYSMQPSVDAFLEHRTKFLEVGKHAIALYIIRLEQMEILFNTDREELSWYKYLFNKLNAPFEKFGENKLSIITFNYDRSIEHFLFTALKNTSGKSDEECARELSKIPIIHVHGKLGALPWQDNSPKSYNPNFTLDELKMASDQIIVIPEEVNTHKSFNLANGLMFSAAKIFFLGFGYHDANLERLKIKEFKNTVLWGTSFGLRKSEKRYAELKWGIKLFPLKVIDFLRNEVPWIELQLG